jgi:hypothetical protein
MKRPPETHEVMDYAAPKGTWSIGREWIPRLSQQTNHLYLPPLLLRSHQISVNPSFCQHGGCFFADIRTTARRSWRANNATSAPGPSNERKPSYMSTSYSVADIRVTVKCSGRLDNGDRKRTSDDLDSNNEPNSKWLKSNNEKPTDEEQKDHPIVQNGLYAAEMMAAHVARRSVVSCIIRSKSSKRQRLIALISRTQTTSFTSGILIGRTRFNALASISFRTFPASWSCCALPRQA